MGQIRDEYEVLDRKREELLGLHRKVIRRCSEVIKKIHRREWGDLESNFDEIRGDLKILREGMKPLIQVNVSNYLLVPEQEFCEAEVLWSCIKDSPVPSPADLEISPLSYLLGLADAVGELRRECLDNIREDHIDQALRSFEQMEAILDGLFTFDFPKGLLPRLRKKVDAARNIVNRTRADVTMAIQSRKLNENFQKFFAGHGEDGR
ncbi:MAG: hypothetical protein ACTSU5_17405 [Promethearchaeota archaeon]